MTVPRSLSPRGLLCGVLFGLSLWVLIALAFVAKTQAQEATYTAEDTTAAIQQASQEIGVSAAYLTAIVRCEDPTLDPYAVGRQGELGAVQLHPRGELIRFYRWGYLDPYSPYQAVRFLAQRVAMGGASAWSCS